MKGRFIQKTQECTPTFVFSTRANTATVSEPSEGLAKWSQAKGWQNGLADDSKLFVGIVNPVNFGEMFLNLLKIFNSAHSSPTFAHASA